MTTKYTSNPSGWHRLFRVIWEGNKKPSRWLIRIVLILILYYAISWLWPITLDTALWPQPVKSFSLALLIVMILAAIWILITIWRLVSSLGGRGVIVLLVAWYAFAVGIKLLTLPPGEPVLSALPRQIANVTKEGVATIPHAISGIPKAISDFQFAYTGHRDPVDLPGVDAPSEPLTGNIIEPNYITVIETPALARTPDLREDVSTPDIPTTMAVSEPESVVATSSPLPIQEEISIGVYVVVANTEGDPLRAHITPGVDTEITARFPEGSQLLVLDGPVAEGDYIWWLVEDEQEKGWCAGPFLEPVVKGD